MNYTESALVGQSATINLSIVITNKPHPPINSIRWYHDDIEVDLNTNSRYNSLYKDGVILLTINDVMAADNGSYDVIVSNIAGSDSASFDVTVEGL